MIVRYNGGRESHAWCTAPDKLVVGKLYKVTNINKMNHQANYTLEGVVGEFYCDWFEQVEPVYVGISRHRPVVGKLCSCRLITLVKGTTTKFIREDIDGVTDVCEIGLHIYKVTTKDSIYYIVSGE